jgi:hypothetical protein
MDAQPVDLRPLHRDKRLTSAAIVGLFSSDFGYLDKIKGPPVEQNRNQRIRKKEGPISVAYGCDIGPLKGPNGKQPCRRTSCSEVFNSTPVRWLQLTQQQGTF